MFLKFIQHFSDQSEFLQEQNTRMSYFCPHKKKLKQKYKLFCGVTWGTNLRSFLFVQNSPNAGEKVDCFFNVVE